MGSGESALERIDANRAAWREVGDELVVLDLTSSSYFSVNETGAALWPHLEGGATREALIDSLLDLFDVDRPTAERDVNAFLEALSSRGLLVTR